MMILKMNNLHHGYVSSTLLWTTIASHHRLSAQIFPSLLIFALAHRPAAIVTIRLL